MFFKQRPEDARKIKELESLVNELKKDAATVESLEKKIDELKARSGIDDLRDELKRLKRSKRELKSRLEKERDDLKEELVDLELAKKGLETSRKIEEEDIKHQIKMLEENLDIKFKQKELALKAEHAEKIAELKEEYHGKAEEFLNKQIDQIKETNAQILERLPNVSIDAGVASTKGS